MSSLIVKVRQIDEILPHPNADRLEIAVVGGWRCIVGLGSFKAGDKCVYFPPDCVLPESVAEKFGITKYLAPLRTINGIRPPGLRVRAQRFRGEPSFGTVQPCENPDWPIDFDLVEYYGVTKWEPPLSCVDGDAAKPVAAFHKYTDIENFGNYIHVFEEGEEIVISEKLHGMNARIGKIRVSDDETGNETWEYMAGSHDVRRKEFDAKGRRSDFWLPLDEKKGLLDTLCDNKNNVIVFGELCGTQDMRYGLAAGERDFLVFDISVNGKYLDYDKLVDVCNVHDVKMVPVLYHGPFSRDIIAKYTDGPTTVCPADAIKEPFKGREGIVFRPVKEALHFDLPGSNRKILKSISVDYHDRRNKDRSENH